MNCPKVSIVIPVYNVENYIQKCLESVINQTFKDIEIVCVNDGSTDTSLNILMSYAEKDKRIIVVDCKENGGLLVARKKGVEVATGEYLIFLDSDDYIDVNLCQFIFETTKKEDADIIQFSSAVDCGSKNKNFEMLKNALEPYEKTLVSDEILEHAYIKRSFPTQVWAKIYRTALCKEVYSILPDEHCYVGEDVFAMFFLTMFAKKYIGIRTPGYYVYRFGLGISGKSKISLSKFEMYAKMANWITFTQNYLEFNKANELQKKACECMKERLFADCCEIFRTRVKEADKVFASDIIYEYWGSLSVNDELWNKHTGFDKKHLATQKNIKEYIISSEKYKKELADYTIVIYGHNNEKYIEQSINNILMSDNNIELIYINDGSSDNSCEILNKMSANDDRIVVINQKYIGVSASKNKALNIYRGKYICYCYAEDIIDINQLNNIILTARNNEAEIILTDDVFENTVLSGDKVLIDCLDNNIKDIIPNCFILKRDFEKRLKLKFNKYTADHDKLFIILALSKAEKVNLASSKYILTEKNISKANTTNFIDNFIISNILNAIALTDVCTDENLSDIMQSYAKIYDVLSKNAYYKLTSSEISNLPKIIPGAYLYLFYKFRDFEEIKRSKTYKISNSLVNIINRFKCLLG